MAVDCFWRRSRLDDGEDPGERLAGTREGGPAESRDDSSSGYKIRVTISIWSPCFIQVCESPWRAKGGSTRAAHVTWVSRRDNAWGHERVKDSGFKMAA